MRYIACARALSRTLAGRLIVPTWAPLRVISQNRCVPRDRPGTTGSRLAAAGRQRTPRDARRVSKKPARMRGSLTPPILRMYAHVRLSSLLALTVVATLSSTFVALAPMSLRHSFNWREILLIETLTYTRAYTHARSDVRATDEERAREREEGSDVSRAFRRTDCSNRIVFLLRDA